MIEFVLHRLKIERRFVPFSIHAEDDFTSAQVISSAINENLARTLRARQTWRIGNVEDIDGNLFFYLGKLKRYDRDKFNEENNQFFHGLETEAPYTFVAIDTEFQICGIAKNPALAPRISGISKNLAKLLDLSETANGRLHFSIDQIVDPVEFLALVENAGRITNFEMTFGQPNPFDVDLQFHKPIEELCKAIKAKKGKIAVEGEDLNKDTIEQVVRSSSSTGHKARMKIASPDRSKPEIRHTDGDPMIVRVEEDEFGDIEGKRRFFDRLRAAYHRVRGGEDNR